MIQNFNQLPSSVLSYLESNRLKGVTGKNFKNISSRSSIGNLIIISNLFTEIKPDHTLEIGMAFGLSTLLFTDLHYQKLKNSSKSQGIQKKRKVHCAVDPFQLSVWDGVGLLIIEQHGYDELLDLHEGFSYIVLPRLLENKKKYDMIYIDGSHLFEDVFIDFYYISFT